ncbi:MAG TPA: hypothetical protein VEK76_08710 [Candidatus Binatia bacterium]|nr:hypothetical protein [Candidatus Binatia bacterium]
MEAQVAHLVGNHPLEISLVRGGHERAADHGDSDDMDRNDP